MMTSYQGVALRCHIRPRWGRNHSEIVVSSSNFVLGKLRILMNQHQIKPRKGRHAKAKGNALDHLGLVELTTVANVSAAQ